MATPRTRIVVVGGGISGLAAAWTLSENADVDVVLVEAGARCGGKLARGEIDGIGVDLGAESLLNTRPEAVDLARAVGLGSTVVHPATAQARLVARGALQPIPAGLVMGAPSDIDAVLSAHVLTEEGERRLAMGAADAVAPLTRDVGLGAFVAEHLGQEVADALVDPLLAGVYAGDAQHISLEAAAPSLFASAQRGGDSFVDVASAARRVPDKPVFAGITGGVGALPDAIVEALRDRGVRIETSTLCTRLRTDRRGHWVVTIRGLTDDPDADSVPAEEIESSGVVLALPAYAAGQLLSTLPERATPAALYDAMRDLDRIPYADVAVLTFAFPLDGVPPNVSGSGFLVPSKEGRFIKAATFSSNKWEWLGDVAAAHGRFVLRCSVGRFGESIEELLDDDLTRRALADLRELLPGLPEPTATRIDPWTQSLPQYLVGHVDRVRRIREGVATLPGLEIAGAAYDGIGIAACIASGARAAGALRPSP